MNNKGQVLVIFIILFPIIVFLLATVIELGFLYFEKNNINDSVIDAVDFYLEHKDEEDVMSNTKILLSKNISGDFQINIDKKSLYVEIEVKKENNGFIKNKIHVIYRGYFDNGNIIKG